ncbi:hypothetical protein PFISCL1PPCAC_2499, partial [Pristionchus fissidentatus]
HKREGKENEIKSSSEDEGGRAGKPSRRSNSSRSSDKGEGNAKSNGNEKIKEIEENPAISDESEGEENDEEKENGVAEGKSKKVTTIKLKKGSAKKASAKSDKNRLTPPLEEDGEYDIFEDEWEELSDSHPTGKDAQRRYLHEKSIFQELTHLKRMQIQYGKVQERVLVHSLVGNFCKMHGLNPADYKFSSFYSWEKYLYEQLKSIYVEERQRLVTSSNQNGPPRPSHAQRLNKFETKLRQARAVPLNDRIRELTRIYGSASMTAGKKVQKRD